MNKTLLFGFLQCLHHSHVFLTMPKYLTGYSVASWLLWLFFYYNFFWFRIKEKRFKDFWYWKMSIFGSSSAFNFNSNKSGANPNKDIEVQQPPSDTISCLKFSPNANFLIASSWDNNVSSYALYSKIFFRITFFVLLRKVDNWFSCSIDTIGWPQTSIFWAQNPELRIMNFEPQNSHTSSLFKKSAILKLMDKASI